MFYVLLSLFNCERVLCLLYRCFLIHLSNALFVTTVYVYIRKLYYVARMLIEYFVVVFKEKARFLINVFNILNLKVN